MRLTRTAVTLALLAGLGIIAPHALAERMERLGEYEAHYSLVPTTLLSPSVVADYGISRGRDRALLSISILDGDGMPVAARLEGEVKDLLGLTRPLELREVREGQAIYYLSEIRHGDQEVLRFVIDVQTPDGASHTLAFQQKLYLEGAS